MTGAVRDYSAIGFFPYTQQNFLFVGDDTTSASGSYDFAYMAVTAVPEPGTLSLGLGVSEFSSALLGESGELYREVELAPCR